MSLQRNNINDYRNLILLSLSVVCICVLVAFLSDIALPLPENEKGIKTEEGTITNCYIEHLNRAGFRYYVSFSISGKNKKYSANFNSEKALDSWNKICHEKSNIKFEYVAKSVLFRPQISYMVIASSVQTF